MPKDEAEAVKWYRAAAEQGQAEAQFNLAGCYRNGWGVPKDEAEAVKWYRAVAEQGDVEAQSILGLGYLLNTWGEGVDLAEAEKWLRLAAEQGDEPSQKALKQAEDFRVLLKKAQQGDAESQYRVSFQYELDAYTGGWSIKKGGRPEEDACYWLKEAAKRGHEAARREVSAAGYKSCLKEAREGKPMSMFSVAMRYEYGMGTKKNMEKARYWYKKAAEKWHYRSKQKLQEMEWE